MSNTIQGENAAEYAGKPGDGNEEGYTESEDFVADPTAMSGTLETSDTSGKTTSAADVSPVFDVANEAEVAPEGLAQAPEVDPEATGEDALQPEYDEDGEDSETDPEQDGEEPFDPSEHDVKGVLDYLETADDGERKRVLDAEKSGKNRKGVLD